MIGFAVDDYTAACSSNHILSPLFRSLSAGVERVRAVYHGCVKTVSSLTFSMKSGISHAFPRKWVKSASEKRRRRMRAYLSRTNEANAAHPKADAGKE